MASAAPTSSTINPPPGRTGPGCTFRELATVVAMPVDARHPSPIPDRKMTQLENERHSPGWTKKSRLDRQKLPALQLGDPKVTGEQAHEIVRLFLAGQAVIEVAAIQAVLSKHAQCDYYT